MKLGNIAIAAGALAMSMAVISPANAQGPMWDRVNVNLPYTVTVGERTLQPGEYVIQQLRDTGGGSRILLIYSDNGMKFETSAMTIPALDTNTARDTKVVLHHFGNDYYMDKVWIQGKDYGYEFPVPDRIKSREKERMAGVSVPAQYQTVDSAATTAATTAQQTSQAAETAATSAATSARQTTAQATTEQATTARETTPQAATTPTTARQTSAAAETPATAPMTPAPATTTARATSPAYDDANSANRAMPETSAGWLMMLMGGGTLSGLGIALRRKR